MGDEAEAAGDVLTGGIVAATIENEPSAPGAQSAADVRDPCRNCGATLTGPFCAACGQSARIHRSLLSLGHDILHGVFHFEGKIWRTLPELFFHPGRLTRRYIDGERAKFVSPMALFLFAVFLMFAVFSFTGGALLDDADARARVADGDIVYSWQDGKESAIRGTEQKIATLREQLTAADLTPEQRAKLESRIAELESARGVMQALRRGDWRQIFDQEGETGTQAGEPIPRREGHPAETALERKLKAAWQQATDNPSLLLYKLKVNGYKFSWALIPLSLPFLWLLFCWRRDVPVYDHAIFATYSISFVTLLLVICSLASVAGVSSSILETALFFAPPIHMYRHLRGTYGLSRFGTLMRLFLLLIAITLVLILFTLLLLLIGVLG